MLDILYQFKRDLSAYKRLGCPQTYTANLVAISGNALHGVYSINIFILILLRFYTSAARAYT